MSIYWAQKREAISKNGMVSANNYHGTKAGVEILKKGGNAVDAVIASVYTDAVAQCQRNGGIGGGGYMTVYIASEDKSTPIYFHMKTPENAFPEMFQIDIERGHTGGYGWAAVKDDQNKEGYKSICVPGLVAGLSEAFERWASMDIEILLKPAICLAQEGFVVEPTTKYALDTKTSLLAKYPATARIYLRDGYFTPSLREKIVSTELAKTMKLIASEGMETFYKGTLGSSIVNNIQDNNGILTEEDLASYEPIVFDERKTTYRDCEVHYGSYAGGTTCIEMMNILEHFDLPALGQNNVESLHLIAEAMRLAYTDRQTLMGGYFDDVPIEQLEFKEYARELGGRIDPEGVLGELGTINPSQNRESTTHVSTADSEGNMVALTYTNENTFGSGVTIPKTGILMNNMMASFNPLPGYTNSVGPRKNALSNMTPVVIVRDGSSFMTVGAAGSRRIETTTMQVIFNVVDYEMSVQRAVDAPRIRREMDPELYVESGFSRSVIKALRMKGHSVSIENDRFATLNAIVRDPETKKFHGGVDRFLIKQWQAKAEGY
jgi:gamma-glutamyltranspeptidase/glutathione hydrolase